MGSNFLSDVGRAQPTQSIRDLIQTKLSMNADDRAAATNEMDLSLKRESLEQAKRKGEYEQQEMARMNQPIPIETVSHLVEGGENGPMFKYLYGLADSIGFVDKSQGGMGAMKRRDYFDLHKMMQEPEVASKLSGMRIGYYREMLTEAKAILAEKPNDKAATEMMQRATTGLTQASWADANLKESLKKQADYEREQLEQTEQNKRAILQSNTTMGAAQVAADSRIKAAGIRNKAEGGGGGKTVIERAYSDFIKEPGNESVNFETYKNEIYNKPKESGVLTDNTVLQRIEVLGRMDPKETARLQKRYFALRKQGIARDQAYQTVVDEVEGDGSAPAPGKKKGDYSYLWD